MAYEDVTGRACCLCRHWAVVGDNHRHIAGTFSFECRRHSPVLSDKFTRRQFPITDSADWCGDFEMYRKD